MPAAAQLCLITWLEAGKDAKISCYFQGSVSDVKVLCEGASDYCKSEKRIVDIILFVFFRIFSRKSLISFDCNQTKTETVFE